MGKDYTQPIRVVSMERYVLLIVTLVAISASIVTGCELETATVNVVIGSSDGSANQTFDLTSIPLVNIGIWVNEVDSLSDEEMARLVNNAELEVNIVRDESGNIDEFWVKWQETDNLSRSSENERYYEVDKDSGTIKFGDGQHGARPPAGKDNIKVSYALGDSATRN